MEKIRMDHRRLFLSLDDSGNFKRKDSFGAICFSFLTREYWKKHINTPSVIICEYLDYNLPKESQDSLISVPLRVKNSENKMFVR
ncbi:hypothetical protein A0128_08010 [Leptospira tipperaryensis]|uniref:Uncharacterized protein n=1 Tax=Leptospira tipperaryensis TaxID=2564040 RepID=A0A1D7UW61_9LEPT|nr:hypothetical protein A0128_08010 [Leptospira tipperaryensis]